MLYFLSLIKPKIRHSIKKNPSSQNDYLFFARSRRQWLKLFLFVFSFTLINLSFADDNVLNIYVWYSEIPDNVIKQFEKETGITVNVATYDDNETLYAKIKASPNEGYDIIEPSSYYVDRMSRQNMLQKIDTNKLPNYFNLDPQFLHRSYDPKSEYSMPWIWGATGIFVNKKYFDPKTITTWATLWDKKYRNQIMFLNDPREAFSVSLITLGYSPNDSNSAHIHQAYLHLLDLLPNIRLFNSSAIPSIFIDEDATLGMAWSGDVYRASKENANLTFVYPKDGFVIWVDNFALPAHVPHLNNAYKFLNFLLRPDIAKQTTLQFGYATANLAAKKQLPLEIQNNSIIFPDKTILAQGRFQTDISNQALKIYAKYWEMLKTGS